MKKILLILGCVALVLIIFAAWQVDCVAIKVPSEWQVSSKAFVDTNTPILISTWSVNEFLKIGSIKFREATTEQQWNLNLPKLKQLGKLEKYGGCEGRVYTTLTFQKGLVTTAAYTAYAKFSNGPAEFKIDLIRKKGQWQIDSFGIDSPNFYK